MATVSLSAVVAEIKANPAKHYVYLMHRPCGSPFYVGVGTKQRVWHHKADAASGKRSPKNDVIREIAAAGGEVRYSVAGWFDDWDDAATEEKRLIALYGRADLGKGILTNRTNGGRGCPGVIWSEETLERRSTALKGKPLTEETKAKLSAAKKGRPMGEKCNAARDRHMAENRDKVSAKFKANWADPVKRAEMLALRKGWTVSPERREKQRVAMMKHVEDPEFRARRKAAQLAGIARWKEDRLRKAQAQRKE